MVDIHVIFIILFWMKRLLFIIRHCEFALWLEVEESSKLWGSPSSHHRLYKPSKPSHYAVKRRRLTALLCWLVWLVSHLLSRCAEQLQVEDFHCFCKLQTLELLPNNDVRGQIHLHTTGLSKLTVLAELTQLVCSCLYYHLPSRPPWVEDSVLNNESLQKIFHRGTQLSCYMLL